MSVSSEINRIKANVAETYAVLGDAGATMPSAKNTDNLAETAASISSVLYVNQSLSDAQKEQARQNIGAASKENSIFYVVGTGSTAGTWLGTHPDITAYFDGLTIAYKIAIAGASTTTLNINGLGAKTVRRATSNLTTNLGVNSIVHLTYTTIDGTGYWVWADYDSNTKVTQSQSSTATGKYGVLLSYYTQDKTTTTAQTVRRDNNFYYQPSTGTLTVKKVVGTLSGDIENCPTVNTLSTTVGSLSTTVGSLSTTVGSLSTTVGSLSTTVEQSTSRADACFSVLEPLEILVPGININPGNYVYGYIHEDGSISVDSWGPKIGFVTADYVPVQGGRTIGIYWDAAEWNKNNQGIRPQLVEYDANKNPIVAYATPTTYVADQNGYTLNANTAYIKLSFNKWAEITTALTDIDLAIYYIEDARMEFVEYGVGAEFTYGVTGSNVVLTAPNRTKYRLTVSNTGALGVTAI